MTNYHPIPFEGYAQGCAVREEGCYKRWKYMEPILKSDKKLKILDIGCERGFFSFMAAKMGHDVVGVDIDHDRILEAISIAEKKGIDNIFFGQVFDLKIYLEVVPDNEYDFVFYLSVHHHIYEQVNGAWFANEILKQISRISKNMFFDMGQPDEERNPDMRWATLIPQFKKPKIEILNHVIDNSDFKYGEVISSTKIHGVERWLYHFERAIPTNLSAKTLIIALNEYTIEKYMWKDEGSQGKWFSSKEGFPGGCFGNRETNARYYIVEDKDYKVYFVKEKLYNWWLDMTPEEDAKCEYDRGQKLIGAGLGEYVCVPFVVDRNFLISEACLYAPLLSERSFSVETGEEIIGIARRIYNVIGPFDFNLNNILFGGRTIKFIDFEHAECNFGQRTDRIRAASTQKCVLCGGTMSGVVVKDLVKCSVCGSYRKEVIPSKEEIKETTKNMMLGACFDKGKEVGRIINAHRQIDTLEKYIKPGLVYDVGAAAGFFMKAAKDRQWIVSGNEISQTAICWAKDHYNLNIEYGLLEDLDFMYIAGGYDAVVLWNTLEHVIDPVETINICKSLLVEGGLILIEVPEKTEKNVEKDYEGPHLTEFNGTSLIQFMLRMGFEIVEFHAFEKSGINNLNILCRKGVV